MKGGFLWGEGNQHDLGRCFGGGGVCDRAGAG